jgi:gamma-glutamyltranspeptidase / glutathione hydrolase
MSHRVSRLVAAMAIVALFLIHGRLVSADGKQSPQQTPLWQHAVVAADHPAASAAGLAVLKKGGNVVDAAVATAAALSVVRPESCGLGGGGFMVIWNAKTKQAVAVDYRERAPRRATRTMYFDPRDPTKVVPRLSREGHRAAAVPGTVAGWCEAQRKYGKLKLADVLAPAIKLAKDGVPVDATMRKAQASLLKRFRKDPALAKRFAALVRLYLNGGKPWETSDRFYSPQRAVLELIAARGWDGFYKGPVAEALLAEMKRGGGLMTTEDLSEMQPVIRKPLTGRFDDLQIVTMPPPSSGGVALLAMLNTLTAWEEKHPDRKLKRGDFNSPATVHLLTEMMKHAFADRAAYLGDADFAKVPVQRLISRKYAAALAARIDMRRTHPLKYYGRFQGLDDAGTSHFCVIDARGNAVACTETINTGYGSLVVEPKYGIVLNNEMDDFAAMPGKPNAFGLIQSDANAVAPRKKPLSSMTPTIAVKDGKAVFVVGASGGPRIISSTLQVLLDMQRFGMRPAKAVAEPRFHHQWVPDELLLERGLFEKLRKPLAAKGHTVRLRNSLSATQAASRGPAGLQGGSDPRKGGRPAGY